MRTAPSAEPPEIVEVPVNCGASLAGAFISNTTLIRSVHTPAASRERPTKRTDHGLGDLTGLGTVLDD